MDYKKSFIPLDGQQRLTTLFLLYLYANKIQGLFKDMDLSKFSYDTRRAARDFCKVVAENDWIIEDRKEGDAISYSIKNSSWFMDYWQYDPTVSSMLNMLDAINKKGQNFDFLRLDEIKFYFFDMEEHNLNENLYVKMNSRGKPLTSFENLKVNIEKLFDERDSTNNPVVNPDISVFEENDSVPSGNNFKDKWTYHLDREWTDYFWKNRSSKDKNHLIDIEFTQFICRFLAGFMRIYGEKDLTNDEIKESLCINAKDDVFIPFGTVKNALLIPGAFEALTTVLTGYSRDFWKEKTLSNWGAHITQIDEYKNLAVIHGNLIGLTKGEEERKKWVRFCWNMVDNYIKGVDSYLTFCNILRELKSSNNLYKDLAALEGTHNEQLTEEIIKAAKINDDSIWEEKFIQAEKYGFFKGAIRFLFTNEIGETDFSQFDEKWKNTQKYFKADGSGLTKEFENATLLKSVISRCTNFWELLWWDKKIFNNRKNNWRELLLNKGWQNSIHHLLIGDNKVVPTSIMEIKPLLEEGFLDHIIEKMPDAWIRNKNGFFCIWESHKKGRIVLNPILYDLAKMNMIRFEWPISNSGYGKGWGGCIDFCYKDKKFRWQETNWVDMYEDGVKLWDKRDEIPVFEQLHSQFNGSEEYQFKDTSTLLKELDRCIIKYESISSKDTPNTES